MVCKGPWCNDGSVRRAYCIKCVEKNIVWFRKAWSHDYPLEDILIVDRGFPTEHNISADIIRVGLYSADCLFVAASDMSESDIGRSVAVQQGVGLVKNPSPPGQPGDQRHLARRLLKWGLNAQAVWYMMLYGREPHAARYDTKMSRKFEHAIEIRIFNEDYIGLWVMNVASKVVPELKRSKIKRIKDATNVTQKTKTPRQL